jgi:hypothetical protein
MRHPALQCSGYIRTPIASWPSVWWQGWFFILAVETTDSVKNAPPLKEAEAVADEITAAGFYILRIIKQYK